MSRRHQHENDKSMHEQSPPRKRRYLFPGAVALLTLLLAAAWLAYRQAPAPSTAPRSTEASSTETPSAAPFKVRLPVKTEPQIHYDELNQDPAVQELMDRRGRQYGLKEGLDLIVGRDESVRIGDQTFSMAEIERLIALREGRIVENAIGENGAAPSTATNGLYGIHVVRPGENIWNIHFKLLQGYFRQKGILLSRWADEPQSNGSSSGVGRLLKFSEHMVYVYNLNERRLDQEITLIQPLSKIVIYNMDRVLALLEGIDYRRIDQIRFDGETLWLPAAQ